MTNKTINIDFFKCILLVVSLLFVGNQVNAMAIQVFAGNDSSICDDEEFSLTNLGAYITGDVDDGTWFTLGDGEFFPGNTNTGVFSVVTSYIPGPNDIASGDFQLILVSDDPDGNGPMVEVSDNIFVDFINVPNPVCSTNLNVSLDGQCEQQLDVLMLITNPYPPYNKYTVETFDGNGIIIPNNILTNDHIGQNITFSVLHQCSGISCWGNLNVEDYIAPIFSCGSSYIECGDETSAEEVGFPISGNPIIDMITETTFSVSNWDACGDVDLSYVDVVSNLPCSSPYDRLIVRKWTAIDESGNNSICNQSIYIEKKNLSDVILPPNYDGISNPPIECGSSYPITTNGYPSPDFTGYPITFNCSNLEATYTDTPFDQCGAGLKIARSWLVIDWCTTQSFNHNQIIKVADTQNPEIVCPSDIVIYTQSYTCEAEFSLLPNLISVEDCSNYNVTYKLKNISGTDFSSYLNIVNNNISVEDIPFDGYIFTFEVTDDCGNKSTCSYDITIEDNKVPFAICDQFTSATLGADGIARVYATTLDDGSFDNCGVQSFEIAKIDDNCGWGLDFGDYAEFCCAEAGTTVMVALKVTDIHGLSNTCMVQVLIEEKLPPTIVCPDDLTISCDFIFDYNDLSIFGTVQPDQNLVEPIIINDSYNNGAAGFDGYINDNCQATVTESYVTDINCYEGTITRKFVVTDPAGNSDSCFQVITIQNFNQFDLSDITWPANYDGVGCNLDDVNVGITGEPTYTNESCALVEATYEDQIFYIADNACVKVLRTWTVIEWCQFEENQSSIWNHVQVIKVNNTIAPVFDVIQTDTIVCSYAQNCGPAEFDYIFSADDDCTATENLVFSWTIDYDNNGTIEKTGNTNHIVDNLLIGVHKVSINVEDKCGNLSTDAFLVEVKDCKLPTPYCNSSLTTTVMDSFGFVTILADQFDLGSTDNCTSQEDLLISFSSDINDISKTFYCDDIPNGVAKVFEIEMWVTDEAGNQEFCIVEVIVQDNTDECEDLELNAIISGSVTTEDSDEVEGVKINFNAFETEYNASSVTNGDGIFINNKLLSDVPYTVKPSFSSTASDGLTTLDIVLLQRHILKLSEFNSPYQVLAGDVNGSNSLTASDLVEMRKVILGLSSSFKNEKPTWVFVDKQFEFQDTLHPWEYPDSIIFTKIVSGVTKADFVAIKRGDINRDWKPTNFKNTSTDSRNSKNVDFKVVKDSGSKYEIFASADELIFGFQLSLEIDESNFSSITTSNPNIDLKYALQNGRLNISAVSPYGIILNEEEALLELIYTNDNLEIDKNGLLPQVYFENEIGSISLFHTIKSIDEEIDIKFISNVNNIEYQGVNAKNVNISVISIDGKLVKEIRRDIIIDKDQISLNGIIPGVYIITLSSDDIEYQQKLFIN